MPLSSVTLPYNYFTLKAKNSALTHCKVVQHIEKLSFSLCRMTLKILLRDTMYIPSSSYNPRKEIYIQTFKILHSISTYLFLLKIHLSVDMHNTSINLNCVKKQLKQPYWFYEGCKICWHWPKSFTSTFLPFTFLPLVMPIFYLRFFVVFLYIKTCPNTKSLAP